MLARPGPEILRSLLTLPNSAQRNRRGSPWSSSAGGKSACPPSDATTRYACPSVTMRDWPRPVPAAISPMVPPALGVPGWSTRNLSAGSVRTPWAAASRSLMSLMGTPAAAARRRSSTCQGRFVATQRPSTTGPAMPTQPTSTLSRGAPRRNASTALSRLSISRLGTVASRTIDIPAPGSKTASRVLVPPTSPARIMARGSGLLPALLEKLGDEPRPAGLVAGADAGTVVAVKVLVEGNQAAPVRVSLEDAREPPRQLGPDLPEVHLPVGARGTRDLEIVAEETVELLERLDQEKVDREPHRSAPVRVAAEEARRRLRGLVVHAVVRAVHPEDVGVVLVVARQRADTVGREELRFVQHEAEDPGQLLARHDRQHEAPPAARHLDFGNVLAELGVVVDEPARPAPEARQAIGHVRVPRLDGEERDQAHQRAYLHPLPPAVREGQNVVVEAVFLVPEAHVLAAHVADGMGDVDEVFEELAGHVLVGGIFARQLERDGQHVEAVHAHPARAVRLLDVAPGRQR